MSDAKTLNLDVIEALASAATPDLQSWFQASYPNACTVQTPRGIPVALFYGENPKADGLFSARARGYVLALIARVRELEQERDTYKRAKSEDDDRFMCERDEARERVRELEQELQEMRVVARDAAVETDLVGEYDDE